MIAGIMIGASIFVQPSEITGKVPSIPGIFAVWIISGLLTSIGALVCAELASTFAQCGGVYVFLREAFSPAVGFLWGWAMFWSIHSGIIAAVSVIYLVMREFSSNRADTEVVDKKAEWDDSNRTLHFSMKVLGGAHNLGDHWEIAIPKPAEFSNLDDAKRTYYFIESVNTAAGTIRGITRVVLPSEARQFKWDESRRAVTYVMPPAGGASGLVLLWIAAAALIGIGAACTVASFVIKPTQSATPDIAGESQT